MHDSATSTDAGIAANSGVSSVAACQSPSPSTPASTMLGFGSASPATPTTRSTRVTTATSASTPPHRSPPHHPQQQQQQQQYSGSRQAASVTEYRLPTAATISLAPTTTTTVVTTTTTTTTHFPPLILKPPPLPRDLDPKEYPLADTPTPPALKRFCFDMNGQPTFFREDEDADKAIVKLQETMRNMRRTGPTSTRTITSMNSVNSMQSPVFSQEVGIGNSRKRPASPIEPPYGFLPSEQNGNGPGFEERTARTIRSISPPPKRPRARSSGSASQEQDDEQSSQMMWTEFKNELRPVLEAAASNRPAMSPASVLAESSTSPTIMQPTPVSTAARHYGTISTNSLGMDTPSTTRSTHSSALPSPSLSPVTGVSANAGGNQFDNFFGEHASRNDVETEESALENAPLQENQDSWNIDATAAPEPLHVPSLLDLPTMLATFDALPATMQSYMIFHMLRRCPTNTLQYVSNIILPALRKDFLGQLPLELGLHVVRYLDAPSMCRAARVSKKWRDVLDSDGSTWRRRLLADGYVLEEGEEHRAVEEDWSLFDSMEPARRRTASVDANLDSSSEMETVIEFDGEETENAQHTHVNPTPALETDMSETTQHGDNGDNSCNDDECARGVTGYPMHSRDVRPRSSQRKKRPSGSSQRKRRRTAYELYDEDDDSESEDVGSQFVTKKHDLPLVPAAKHPYKAIYRKHHLMRQNWHYGRHKHISFAGHGNNVVTCLQFDSSKIISGSDDQCINVYDTSTGELRKRLGGHEGGVWALQYVGNTLVSGSTDRTVRIWDIEKGECTHVFHGHTSTVRCLQIIMPQVVDPNSDVMKPERPLIITGSRDSTLRVWHLPKLGEEENWRPDDESGDQGIPFEERHIPWFVRTLTGHTHSVRALAGAGNTLVSGSYDCSVRVWNIETGECFWRLHGHSQKVYSVVLDTKRNRCMSGSMDGTVKVWSLEDGSCLWTLEGHSSLVGLLDLSHDHLVSAAADSSLRIWNPNDGTCKHVLTAHTGAITCFQHDENKVISGSDGTLKMWDVKTGQFIRDLLTGLSGVWQVRFDERRCVAAVQRNQVTWFEVLDFGVYGIEDDDDIKDNNGNWVPRRKIVGANSANNA